MSRNIAYRGDNIMRSSFGKERCLLYNGEGLLRAVEYKHITGMERFKTLTKVLLGPNNGIYISNEDSKKLQQAYIGCAPQEEVI